MIASDLPFDGRRPNWLAVDGQGDVFFAAPGSVVRIVGGSITIAVSAANTTTALTASPGTSVSGQSVTFTAAVTPAGRRRHPHRLGPVRGRRHRRRQTRCRSNSTGTASLALNSLGWAHTRVGGLHRATPGRLQWQHGNTSITVEAATASNIQSVVNGAASSGGSVTIQTTSSSAVSTAFRPSTRPAPQPRDGHAGPRRREPTPTTAIGATGGVQVDLTSSSGTATVQAQR